MSASGPTAGDDPTDGRSRPARVGYIGLGHLGGHLAAGLVRAGHQLTVHDLDPARGDALVASGARRASSIAEVAGESEVVFTCLPSPAAVDAVIAGPDGLLAHAVAGTTWIDNSTNDRDETLRLAALAAAHGVRVLEAPVTGGVHKAAAGEITVLVGGDAALVDEHRHLLDAIGSPVLHMGDLGSAAVIKVITNMLAFVHLVAAGEALMLAKRGGLDLAMAFEAIRHSSGNSFVHETESQLILNGSYDIAFTMDLACKDLGFATDFGRRFGVPLDLAAATEQTFVRARQQYGGDAWSTQVVKLLEDALGTDLRAPGFPPRLA
ncbi:MAG: NAD(P)-dependent oxidoreductase [Acidimicrobiaceae bacterium]|nr:NAD(P)-dependent oxidoreductase [Acidimicrobiaceae bacterium]